MSMRRVRQGTSFVTSLLAIAVLVILSPATATAQAEQAVEADPTAELVEPDAADEAAGKGIEEITVTSRKREERLQDVPISLTAFSGAQLDETQTFNALDVQFQVPNMLFGKGNFTGANLQIRGVGTQVVAATAESAVSVHMNNVPVAASRIFETEFYDVERIEVLRGPQGTLFGRNSTGGAYNVYTKKPTNEWGGDGEFMYGNFNNIRVRGALNMPVHDRFKMRFAGTFLQRDGFTENIGTGNDIDDRDLYGVRGSLLWEPTDDLTIDVMGSWFREEDSRSRIGKQLCTPDNE
ncbi:MAG: TonB-dependent receptor, partial [Deltaproteobacteria bacterium]|nr:TonB-dependent receptor [Deltaproteobacteria bacterium]